jgi:RimJ/RimL family protein N-acetyltransferase
LTGTSRIETDRLELEPLAVDDADEMATVLADPGLYRFIGGRPPTPMELRHLYGRWIAGPSRPGEAWHNWAVRLLSDGTLVGHVQATVSDEHRQADIAWIIGAPWHGHGYATEAGRALIAWLEAGGVLTVTAHIDPRHQASAGVAKRAGLVPTDLVEGGEVVWRRPSTGTP